MLKAITFEMDGKKSSAIYKSGGTLGIKHIEFVENVIKCMINQFIACLQTAC